jgi:hypothetical protein
MFSRIVLSPARRRLRLALGVITLIGAMLASGSGMSAAVASTVTPMTALQWNTSMSRSATPGKGCYTAAYPATTWKAAACATAPNRPYVPATGGGASPAIVGNGVDFSAGVTGVINGVTGSFPVVTGVTSEMGSNGIPNSYSLQLNAKPFATPVCGVQPLCQGWEQFIYSSQGVIFIQFWLEFYNTTCPAGWSTYAAGGNIHCYKNGTANLVAPQPITNLGNLVLTGTATAGGVDTVYMSTTGPTGSTISATSSDSTLKIALDWSGAEFGVFGDGNAMSANFNAGSTVTVQTAPHNGTTNAPTCHLEGYTGETNNLTLVGTPALTIGPSPAIRSTQSNVPGGTPPSCKAAKGWGEVHMITLDNQTYENQATGTYEYAQSPDFSVQAQQIPATGPWTGLGLTYDNEAGVRMGSDTVSMCWPNRLIINGTTTSLADGQIATLPSGNTVSRNNNANGFLYTVRNPAGDMMTAQMNQTAPYNYIDVGVGLGSSDEPVTGMMANVPGTTQLATRSGTIVATPMDFNTFYNVYAKSWQVPPADSLVSGCGQSVGPGLPSQPYWASNLPQETHDQAQAVCTSNRVEDQTLLDGCTLDVAVLGSKSVSAFVGMQPPTSIGWK